MQVSKTTRSWPDHADMLADWRRDPAAFWMSAAASIDWRQCPTQALRTRADGHADWFPDGRLNSCFNALDRHVLAGHGDRPALIWESPSREEPTSIPYGVLLDRVARFAGGLSRLGVGMGDRVLISMPSMPEAVIAMLACARLGAIHVFVFAGFSGRALASRIDATRPRVLIFASCGYQQKRPVPYGEAIETALAACRHPPACCVVLQRPEAPARMAPGRDHDFRTLEAAEPVAARPVAAAHPLYILHSSGTTGQPKGVVRDHGGHAVALALSMSLIYGTKPGDVFCTSSDLGWVVGHSYAVYGPLLAGCTSLLLEGAPEAATFWRRIAAHGVRVVLTSPTALRLMRQQDPEGRHGAAGHDLSRLDCVFVAGERIDRETLDWVEAAAGVPAFDHWWQTETGWPIAGTCRGLPPRRRRGGGLAELSPGFDLAVLGQDGMPLPAGSPGEFVLRLPLPPGCLQTLWNDIGSFRKHYLSDFPGFYRTFDYGLLTSSGEACLLSRADDVLKIAGRRIAGGLIEDVALLHPLVRECAVVGQPDALRGEVPLAYLVLRDEAAGVSPARLLAELNGLIRQRIGGFVRLRDARVVEALPRTRSGKVIRRELVAFAA